MTDNQVRDRIGEEIAANDVVLFMKGTPQAPQCGFSAAVTNVLSQLGVPFTRCKTGRSRRLSRP